MKQRFLSLIALTMLTLGSCDTPQSMAWNHYYFAQQKLEEGDIETAKKYADLAARYKDSDELTAKVDELLKAIDETSAKKDTQDL